MDYKRILLIENPVSGLKFRHSREREVENILSRTFDVDVYRTRAKGDAIHTAARRGRYYDIVGASGGDGTINEVITGLMQIPKDERPSLICIPAGTTNLLTETLGIPDTMAEAARSVVTSEEHPFDIGTIDEVYFSSVISFGFFTDSSYNTPQQLKNIFGYGAYIMGAIKSLSDLEPCHMKVTSGDFVTEGDYILGSVSNVTSMGGVIKLEKDQVDTGDGLFEVLLIKKPENVAQFGDLVSAIAYKEFDKGIFEFFRTDHIIFETDKPVPWTVDGEYLRDFATVDIKLHKGAINVIRP